MRRSYAPVVLNSDCLLNHIEIDLHNFRYCRGANDIFVYNFLAHNSFPRIVFNFDVVLFAVHTMYARECEWVKSDRSHWTCHFVHDKMHERFEDTRKNALARERECLKCQKYSEYRSTFTMMRLTKSIWMMHILHMPSLGKSAAKISEIADIFRTLSVLRTRNLTNSIGVQN